MFLISTFIVFLLFSAEARSPQPEKSTQLQALIVTIAELEYQTKILDYVYNSYLDYGERKVSDDRFLISLMKLISEEIALRVDNVEEAHDRYFKELYGKLDELTLLKKRLKLSGIHELDTFIKDLENRIVYTIDQQDVDFKKKKVFEDALQMLYVSEEMIRLDQQQASGEVSQHIGQSKQDLLKAFGEISPEGQKISGTRPTIYDLFVQWKKTDEVKFALRLADVQMARENLLKASTAEEMLRMFNEQLGLAYTFFNFKQYDLAERLLKDLRECYSSQGITNMDDVLFYQGECNFALNRLLHARENYEDLIATYPESNYLTEIFDRLIEINYTLKDYSTALKYGQQYLSFASTTEPNYYSVQFLIALCYYYSGDFDKTVETLMNIPADHPSYKMSRYFIGNAYADNQMYDEAIATYLGLVEGENGPPFIVARSYYKLGILEYERGNYQTAIHYLSRVDRDFSSYDKVLNALAWSYFEEARQQAQPGEIPDFREARYYAEKLLDEYYASPYNMETTGLLAYINQLENEPLDAIGLYREVYQTKVKRKPIEEYIEERKGIGDIYRESLTLQEEAIEQNNKPDYLDASDLMTVMERELLRLDVTETNAAGVKVYGEIERIISQIKELNALRLKAEETQNKEAIARIDSLQFQMATALDEFPAEVLQQAVTINLFDDYPVSKYVADEVSQYGEMLRARTEIENELGQIDETLRQIDNQISIAKLNQNFQLVAQLEEKQAELEHLKNRYDPLLVGIYEAQPSADPYPEFDRWGDLGAFGIINVYFDQKQQMQGQLVKVADVFDRVNEQLDYRKQVIEDRIKKIEAEIRLMTMKARMEERARLRAERERAFRESYFDTRESETPEQEQ